MIRTRKDLIEEMNYSDGIDYNKMYPSEDDRWIEGFIPSKEVKKRIQEATKCKTKGEALNYIITELGF